MSLQKVGNILELFYSTNDARVNPTNISLDKKGVIKDKYYNKNIQRSVLIASQDSYKLAKEHGIEVPFNSLGENILMDYNPYDLNEGVQLVIGELTLEISQHCTICNSLAKVHPSLPSILKEHRGIFAKVISGGVISKGDEIYLR